ncbi:hypothetical protein TSUD_258230 [Trifolium subterraneum]|uniref:Uncharacterized protein n=1 Tax=Trifolium subterraneum TaxID=3900 RepID=A0A2Z6NT76_TRISU|nr:hypothetical protein TSUD_258230 [Trifolium subterraneum]
MHIAPFAVSGSIPESGAVGKEKPIVPLQKLSMSEYTTCVIIRHGGVHLLIELCQIDNSVSLSAEVSPVLAEEDIVRVGVERNLGGLVSEKTLDFFLV